MASLSTDDFPYTASYVKDLLNVDEGVLMSYVQALSITPKQDEQTGAMVFTHRDLDLLKKALEMKDRATGKTMPPAPQVVPVQTQHPAQAHSAPTQGQAGIPKSGKASLPETPQRPVQPAPAASVALSRPSSHLSAVGPNDATQLTVIVDAVSQAKEGILKDLSRLLDDKLSGLDEVVVELIRCKSENESLRQQLKSAGEEVNRLRGDLDKFKPVQFGFFRKIS